MVAIKLREAMLAYKRRTGERMTYAILAERTGLSHGTLRIIGSGQRYNATVEFVEKLCRALDTPLHEMLEIMDDPPKAKPKPKRRHRSS